MSHFVYRLVPPRPTFGPGAMSDTEAATMQEHGGYWARHVATGTAIVFGPVLDPSGTWGLAVVEATNETDVHALRDADPAVSSGLCTAEILPMAIAFVAGSAA
jgi:uncharacterized protein YciI